jgi:hypothetical protein
MKTQILQRSIEVSVLEPPILRADEEGVGCMQTIHRSEQFRGDSQRSLVRKGGIWLRL